MSIVASTLSLWIVGCGGAASEDDGLYVERFRAVNQAQADRNAKIIRAPIPSSGEDHVRFLNESIPSLESYKRDLEAIEAPPELVDAHRAVIDSVEALLDSSTSVRTHLETRDETPDLIPILENNLANITIVKRTCRKVEELANEPDTMYCAEILEAGVR